MPVGIEESSCSHGRMDCGTSMLSVPVSGNAGFCDAVRPFENVCQKQTISGMNEIGESQSFQNVATKCELDNVSLELRKVDPFGNVVDDQIRGLQRPLWRLIRVEFEKFNPNHVAPGTGTDSIVKDFQIEVSQDIVPVEKTKITPLRQGKGRVSGTALPPVLLMDDPKAGIGSPIGVKDLSTSIGAAIVYAKAFPVLYRLCKNGIKAVAKKWCDVVDGNNDGNSRHVINLSIDVAFLFSPSQLMMVKEPWVDAKKSQGSELPANRSDCVSTESTFAVSSTRKPQNDESYAYC